MASYRRAVLFLLASFQTSIYAGSIHGWAGMEAILLREGQFLELCERGQSAECPSRLSAINKLYSYSAPCLNVASLLVGFLVDRYGPRRMALVCCALCAAGCMLFGASDSVTFNAFLPGLMLFGVGGFGLFMASFSFATLFPDRQGTVLSVFNGAFDCGVVFFGIAQMMYDAGSTRLGIMIGYSVGAAVIAVVTILFVPKQAFVVGDSGEINWRNGAKIGTAPAHDIAMRELQDDSDALHNASDEVKMLDGLRSDAHDPESGAAIPSEPADAADNSSFQSLPFSRQIRSPRHILLLLLFGTTVARMAFFFGTFNAQLLQWFGAEDIAPLSKGFSIIMLAGAFGVFIIGPVLDRFGLAWGFVVTFAAGTVWGVLQFVPSIAIQGLSWVAFALYRAFFFSAVASYMVTIFGYTNMGKVYGFCNVCSAVFSIFNNKLLELVLESAGGSFKEVNGVFLVIQLLQFLFAWFVHRILKGAAAAAAH